MSRSFKKTPIVKDNGRGRKHAKRQANKRVRRTKELSSGKAYRKVYNTWDIYDYNSYCSLTQFLRYPHLWYLYETEEVITQAWRRDFYLK